jgi:hypothetical protein
MRIEEINKQRLLDASDLELKQLKYKFAKFWDRHFKSSGNDIVGSFSRVNFIAKYRMVLREMDSEKRSLSHSTCDIDRQAFKQNMEVKKNGIDIAMLEEIITAKNFVFIDEDFAKADEINVTIRAVEPDEIIKFLLEEEITKSIKELIDKACSFTYDKDYEGDCIPLFNQVLRPVTKIEKTVLKNDGEKFDSIIELLPVEKAGDEHIVYGIVYQPDTVDAQGDKANAEEIKKAAYDFMENVQTFKVMHKGKKVKVKILENYIAPVDFTIEKRNVKKGSWVLVTRILDKKLWKEIKAGKLTGYSMAGYAKVD